MTTVIFHNADFDGLFCREIARKFLPDAELIGWDYGQPKIPVPLEGSIYILDLSPECLDAPYGELLPSILERIIWIDHHKSAIDKYDVAIDQFLKRIPGYRIDGVAACRLAWQWFARSADHASKLCRWDCVPSKEQFINREVTEPLAVRLAGEYDIWDKRDPDAELFQHGLRSQELGDLWPYLLGENKGRHKGGWDVVVGLLQQGRALQYAKTQENASIISDIGFTFKWEGLTFLACNAARYNSHLFTAGLTPEHDACFGFKWTGKDWSVSLYHAPGKEHHDLSQIAVKYGGGGHRGACGFRASKLPFIP